VASHLKTDADAILHRVVSAEPRVPGVVAMATDRRGNIYEGAAGVRALGQDAPMTLDSVFAMFSTTKAVAGTAVLQLVEDGRLDLDAPAKKYAPHIAEVMVLEGMDAAGKPRLRAPKRDITTRMLMLHTAGFAYSIFNERILQYEQAVGHPSIIGCTKASLMTALVHEPGSAWEYGCNIDWCGQVVEGVTGQRFGDFMQERIFDPLGMKDTAFAIRPDMRPRLARIHQRDEAGTLTPLDFELPPDPEVHMGGHGLYSTVPDYMHFIRMWLNDGQGEHGRVLKPETVRMAEQNGLGDMKIHGLPGAIPTLSHFAEFFPGMSKSWALSFMINDETAPTGRSAGALAWAGLANLYFWIDRAADVGGFWATQVFPFVDPTSVGGYLDFETAVYRTSEMKQAA
jgi:methyl acetate hydrolase